MEYPLQSGLPICLKQKAIVRKGDTIIYVWPSTPANELLDWIKMNGYVLLHISVYAKVNEELEPAGYTWSYRGDRTKKRSENTELNILSARKFIDDLRYQEGMYYEILFKHKTMLKEIDREFLDKAIVHRGEITYAAEDALDLTDRCRETGMKITNLEAFLIEGRFIQPTDYRPYVGSSYDEYNPNRYKEIYHINKNFDAGHWGEAKQWVSDRANKGWTFEIHYRKITDIQP